MPPIRQNIQTINILAIMNKILTTAASATLGTSSYVSPEATVTEIHSEGVLCMSGKSLEVWTEGETVIWDE